MEGAASSTLEKAVQKSVRTKETKTNLEEKSLISKLLVTLTMM